MAGEPGLVSSDRLLAVTTLSFDIAVLELLLPLVLKWAEQERVPLLDALAQVTINPALLLGQKIGHLSVGAHADICVYDPESAWKVEPAALKSQGKNTPFNGYEMQGRVRYTLLDGQIVFQQ